MDRRAHRAPVLDPGAIQRSFQPCDIRVVLLALLQQLRREVETKVDRLLAAEGIANDHASVAEAGFDRQIVQRKSSGRQPHRRDEAAVDVDVRRGRRAHGAPDLRRRIDGVVRIEVLLRRDTETADHRRTAERRRSPDRVAEDPAAPAANLIERQAGQSWRDRAGVVDAGGALEQRAEDVHAELAVTGGLAVGRPVRGVVQEHRVVRADLPSRWARVGDRKLGRAQQRRVRGDDQANLRFVEGERDLGLERGEQHARDGVRREHLPPAVRHLQHAGGDEDRWIDPRSIGGQQDLDVALRFVVDHEGPDRALLRDSRRGDEQRRGDNRS